MGDRRAEWSGGRTLGVDVDPLVIVGGVGERVDPILADLPPFAVSEMRADQSAQLVHAADDGRHAAAARARTTTGISRAVRSWYSS